MTLPKDSPDGLQTDKDEAKAIAESIMENYEILVCMKISENDEGFEFLKTKAEFLKTQASLINNEKETPMNTLETLEKALTNLPDGMERNRMENLFDAAKTLLSFRHPNQALNADQIREILPLNALYGAYRDSLSADSQDNPRYLPQQVKGALAAFFNSIAGFKVGESLDKQPDSAKESYGYIEMKLSGILV